MDPALERLGLEMAFVWFTANVSSALKRCRTPPPESLDSHLARCAFPALLLSKIVLSKFHP